MSKARMKYWGLNKKQAKQLVQHPPKVMGKDGKEQIKEPEIMPGNLAKLIAFEKGIKPRKVAHVSGGWREVYTTPRGDNHVMKGAVSSRSFKSDGAKQTSFGPEKYPAREPSEKVMTGHPD